MPDFPAVSGAAPADIWSYATRALTDKAGFTISGTKTTLDSLNDITAADVWGVAARTLTAFTGQPRTDLLGEDADFESATGRPARLDNILAAEAITEASTVMDGSELTLYTKTDTLQRSVEGYIDLTSMAGGDTIVVKESMQIKAAGGFIVYATQTYTGVQSLALIHVVTKKSKRGIKVTVQQTAGTNRTLDNQWLGASQAAAT